MARDVTISVKAQDNASSGLNKISKNVNQLANNIRQTTSPLSNFMKSMKNLSSAAPGLALVAVGVNKVKDSLKQAVEELKQYETAWTNIEKNVKTLDFAAALNKNLGATSRELQLFASQLESELNYTFAGGDFLKAANTLAFDKTAEQIKQILPVAADLSAALGIDLQSAVEQLNNTFSGSVGQLGKMFPELKKLSKEALASGEAVNVLAEKVGGIAKELSDSVNGTLLSTETLKGNLKEELGYWISEFFDPIERKINEIRLKWVEALGNKRQVRQARQAVAGGNGTKEDYQLLSSEALDQITWYNDEARRLDTNRASLIADSRGALTNSMIDDTIKQYYARASELNRQLTNYSIQISKFTNSTAQAVETVAATVEETEEKNEELWSMPPAWLVDDQRDVELFQSLLDEMQEWADGLTDEGGIAVDLSGLTEALSSLGDIGGMIQTIVNGSGWIGVLIQFVSALSASLSSLSESWNAFANIFTEIAAQAVPYFKDAIERFIAPILDTIKPLGEIVGTLLNLIFSALNAFLGPINEKLTTGLQVIANLLGSLFSAVSAIFDSLGTAVMILDLLFNVVEPILSLLNVIFTFLQKVFTSVNYFFNAFTNLLIDIYNSLNGWASDKDRVKSSDGKVVTFDNIWRELADVWTDWSGLDNMSNLDKYNWNNSDYSGIANAGGNMANYTAAKDIYININFDHSFVNGDADEIAIALRDQIRRVERLGY